MKKKVETQGLEKHDDVKECSFADITVQENLDVINAFSFISDEDTSREKLLSKIKVIINLLSNKKAFNYLLKASLEKNLLDGDKKIGSVIFHEFMVTSVNSSTSGYNRYSIHIRHYNLCSLRRYTPGIITSFNFTKQRITSLLCENNVEINILGIRGKEYTVKLGFLGRN